MFTFNIQRPQLLAAQDSGGAIQSVATASVVEEARQLGLQSSRIVRVHYDGVVILQDEAPCTLPIPAIAEAQCGMLDVKQLSGDARVNVADWPAMRAGQLVWLYAVGVTDSGRALTVVLSEGAPVTAQDVIDGFSRLIPKTELEKLVPCSTLRIEMKVSFNPASCCAENEAFRFPEASYVLATYRDLTDFEDGTFNRWQAGPAAPSDTTYFKIQGSGVEHYLYNGTPGGTVAGVILFKTFDSLKCGAPYVFRLKFRSTNSYTNTELYLSVADADSRIADAVPITQQWQTLGGTFTAPSSSVVLQIGNDSAAGIGNDYHIDDIEVIYDGVCEGV